MKKLKTGVVGLGRIGWKYHIPAIVSHEGFELSAVVDPSRERLEEAEAKFFVRGYAGLDEMLQQEQLDLVVIASPTLFHADQTIAAFENGIDVFLEKPMASSLKDADRMIAAMRKHGRKLMVYQPHRTTASYLAAESILNRGILGPIYMIKKAHSKYHRRNDWQAFTKYGGGMLNNYGAHAIDQLLSLVGSNVKNVSSHLRNIASLGDADDVVKALLETDNGIVLDIDINTAIALPLPELVILGQRGTADLEWADSGLRFRLRYFSEEELKELPVHEELAAPGRSYKSADEIPWREEFVPVSDFVPIEFYDKCYDYYALDAPPFVQVEQTREVLRVMEACRECNP